MERNNFKYLVVGQTGTGKTAFCKQFIHQLYKKGSFKKVIVSDEFDSDIWESMETYNHPEWSEIKLPIIPLKKAKLLKSGFARVVALDDDVDAHFEELNKLRNTVLLFEDASRSLEPEVKVPKQVMKIIYNVKQINVDFILVFHSLMDVPSKLFRQCDVLILFKTGDETVPKKANKPEIVQAWNELKKDGNQYAKRKVNLR